jgi:pteridine reductase
MVADKVALVTGSGRPRVGRAIALALADRGYSVAVHYHTSVESAARTVAEIEGRGVNALAVQANLAIESDVDRMIQQVVDGFGRIDVLVNAAAIWESKPLEQVTAADVRRHFEINALGTFLCSQRAGLLMVTQPDGGSIVTIADWAIERPYRNYAAYFPSKGAIPAMTRSLAVELGHRNPKVRVNCIVPGPVMLPPNMPQPERQMVINSTLVKREGCPENVAHAVLFLVENDFVTGVCLPVDGGRTIYAGEVEPLKD